MAKKPAGYIDPNELEKFGFKNPQVLQALQDAKKQYEEETKKSSSIKRVAKEVDPNSLKALKDLTRVVKEQQEAQKQLLKKQKDNDKVIKDLAELVKNTTSVSQESLNVQNKILSEMVKMNKGRKEDIDTLAEKLKRIDDDIKDSGKSNYSSKGETITDRIIDRLGLGEAREDYRKHKERVKSGQSRTVGQRLKDVWYGTDSRIKEINAPRDMSVLRRGESAGISDMMRKMSIGSSSDMIEKMSSPVSDIAQKMSLSSSKSAMSKSLFKNILSGSKVVLKRAPIIGATIGTAWSALDSLQSGASLGEAISGGIGSVIGGSIGAIFGGVGGPLGMLAGGAAGGIGGEELGKGIYRGLSSVLSGGPEISPAIKEAQKVKAPSATGEDVPEEGGWWSKFKKMLTGEDRLSALPGAMLGGGAAGAPPAAGGGGAAPAGDIAPSGGKTPIGIRSNNPFDISLTPAQANKFGASIIGAPGQSGFAKFSSMEEGYKQGTARIGRFISGGQNTISSMGRSYAEDASWPAAVSKFSGIGLNEPLDPTNQEQMQKLYRGILMKEIGGVVGSKEVEKIISTQGKGYSFGGETTPQTTSAGQTTPSASIKTQHSQDVAAGKAMPQTAAAPISGKKSYTGKSLDGVNGALVSAFEQAAAEYKQKTGKTVSVTSGLRSYEDQLRLWNNRGNNPNPVAKPGTSLHERGLAIDVSKSDAEAMDSMGILGKYGLNRPVRGDPVHIQLMGTKSNEATGAKEISGPKMSEAAAAPVSAPSATPAMASPSPMGGMGMPPMISGMGGMPGLGMLGGMMGGGMPGLGMLSGLLGGMPGLGGMGGMLGMALPLIGNLLGGLFGMGEAQAAPAAPQYPTADVPLPPKRPESFYPTANVPLPPSRPANLLTPPETPASAGVDMNMLPFFAGGYGQQPSGVGGWNMPVGGGTDISTNFVDRAFVSPAWAPSLEKLHKMVHTHK